MEEGTCLLGRIVIRMRLRPSRLLLYVRMRGLAAVPQLGLLRQLFNRRKCIITMARREEIDDMDGVCLLTMKDVSSKLSG